MWACATYKQNKEKTWVNLDLARRVSWSKSESHTVIVYDSQHSVIVIEKPDVLFEIAVLAPSI